MNNPEAVRFEFLPQVEADVRSYGLDLRRAIAEVVVALHRNPYLGELMDERPPRILEGCRKVRFDIPSWTQRPRYRLVYRNEPSDGAAAVMCVLAIASRDRMVVYARAAGRLKQRIAEEGFGTGVAGR